MNRRGFLAALAGAVLDPERLLWVPGKKLISIPSPVRLSGPFRVTATFAADGNRAEIIEYLLNHRWVTDPSWHQHAQDVIDRGVEGVLLLEVQQGAGFYPVVSSFPSSRRSAR